MLLRLICIARIRICLGRCEAERNNSEKESRDDRDNDEFISNKFRILKESDDFLVARMYLCK